MYMKTVLNQKEKERGGCAVAVIASTSKINNLSMISRNCFFLIRSSYSFLFHTGFFDSFIFIILYNWTLIATLYECYNVAKNYYDFIIICMYVESMSM